MATRDQITALEHAVEYADTYYAECEAAEYSNAEELWSIIKMFAGIATSIIDAKG